MKKTNVIPFKNKNETQIDKANRLRQKHKNILMKNPIPVELKKALDEIKNQEDFDKQFEIHDKIKD